MLKIYRMPSGKTYQFEESEAPATAVLVEEQGQPETKEVKPANKAKTAKTKK